MIPSPDRSKEKTPAGDAEFSGQGLKENAERAGESECGCDVGKKPGFRQYTSHKKTFACSNSMLPRSMMPQHWCIRELSLRAIESRSNRDVRC